MAQKQISNNKTEHTNINNNGRFIARIKLTLRLYLSRWTYNLWAYGQQYQIGLEKKASKKTRLSKIQIQEYALYEESYIKGKLEKLDENSLFDKPESSVKKLITPILDTDKTIKKVVDLSIRLPINIASLAKKYKKIEFIGLSFAKNIEQLFSFLKIDNLKFSSVYALNFLENSSNFDVVIFDHTATTVQPKELKKYLNLIRNKSKYLILKEPIYNSWTGKAYNPLDIEIDNPVIAREFSHCLIYNYKELVESIGFKVLFYRCEPEDQRYTARREYAIAAHTLSLVAISPCYNFEKLEDIQF